MSPPYPVSLFLSLSLSLSLSLCASHTVGLFAFYCVEGKVAKMPFCFASDIPKREVAAVRASERAQCLSGLLLKSCSISFLSDTARYCQMKFKVDFKFSLSDLVLLHFLFGSILSFLFESRSRTNISDQLLLFCFIDSSIEWLNKCWFLESFSIVWLDLIFFS